MHLLCLMSAAWDVKRKECHWWCHNCDSVCHPLALLLQCDQVILCLYYDLGQINGIAGILKLQKCFRMWSTYFEHLMKLLPLVCFCGYGDLSTFSIAISMVSCQKGPTCHAYAWQIGPFWQDTLDITLCLCPYMVLWCCMWIISCICVSKQG